MARQATATAQRQTTQAPAQQAPAGNLPATTQGNGEQKVHPLMVLKGQLEERQNEFAFALPDHIPVQRFTRVVLTAVQNNPKLLNCDRASFFNSCLRAAQDGLLPDGREGAIVDYKDNKANKVLAQWMPMYQGILKKVRNSGEFKWMTAQIVYEGDEFNHWIDQEGEHFEHRPAGLTERPVKAYSAVTTKSGGAFVEVMTMPQISKVRAASRVKSEYGPWAKWFDEMAKKTAFRRLAKRLPISSDLDDLIRRDDSLYDFEGQREEAQIARQSAGRMTTTAAFDRFAGGPATLALDHDASTGEVIDNDDDFGSDDSDFSEADDRDAVLAQEAEQAAARQREADATAAKAKEAAEEAARKAKAKEAEAAAAAAAKKPDPISSGTQATTAQPQGGAANASPAGAAQPAGDTGTAPAGAQDQGEVDGGNDPGADQDRRWPNGATPSNADEYESYSETKISDFTKPGDVAPWWKSAPEIQLRKTCNVDQEMFNRLLKKAQNRVVDLSKK